MSKPTAEEVEAARKAYKDQLDHVDRIYGNAGHKVLEEESYRFLIDLAESMERAIKAGVMPREYSNKMHSLLHGLGSSHLWLTQQKRIAEELRTKWRTLKTEHGDFISPHARP